MGDGAHIWQNFDNLKTLFWHRTKRGRAHNTNTVLSNSGGGGGSSSTTSNRNLLAASKSAAVCFRFIRWRLRRRVMASRPSLHLPGAFLSSAKKVCCCMLLHSWWLVVLHLVALVLMMVLDENVHQVAATTCLCWYIKIFSELHKDNKFP